MKTPYYIIIAACALAAPALRAEGDMVIEVTQDFSVSILENLPEKPYQAPELLPLPKSGLTLAPAFYAADGSVSALLATLQPASWPMAPQPTPYRGYASLGYAPVLNIGASAGYRFVQSPSASVGAWGQYTLNRYHTGKPSRDIATSQLVVGADAYAKVADAGTLDATVSYCRNGALHPDYDEKSWWLNLNSFAGAVNWHGTPSQALEYNVGADIRHTMFSALHSPLSTLLAPDQTLFAGRASVAYKAENWHYGLDADIAALSSAQGYGSQSLLTLAPAATYRSGALRAKVGVAASVGFGGLGFRLAPNAYIAYAPERSRLAAALNLTGGRTLNPLFSVMALNPYLLGKNVYAPTNVPVDATLSATFGRFAGIRLTASARFACARGALMPNIYNEMQAASINSWLFTIEADYAYSSLLTAKIAYSAAAANRYTWYQWLDGASGSLSADITVAPIEKLSISANYRLRTSRQLYLPDLLPSETIALRNLSLLGISATYSFTPRLSATVQADNLLARRHRLISGYQAQGLTVGASVAYKF